MLLIFSQTHNTLIFRQLFLQLAGQLFRRAGTGQLHTNAGNYHKTAFFSVNIPHNHRSLHLPPSLSSFLSYIQTQNLVYSNCGKLTSSRCPNATELSIKYIFSGIKTYHATFSNARCNSGGTLSLFLVKKNLVSNRNFASELSRPNSRVT